MNWALLYYIIPSIFIAASAVTIAVIYLKKIPKLFSLDLEAMPEHRQLLKRHSIIEDRLARKWLATKQRLKKIMIPVFHSFERMFKSIYTYLRHLEANYRKAAKISVKHSNRTEVNQASLELTLQEAQAAVAKENFAEAEKKYIEAIALDHASIAAYRGLVQVYLQQKNNQHAIETLLFLHQLDPNDEASWHELGRLYRDENKLPEALDAYEHALTLGPNNPKNLDVYIEVAILNKLKYKAQSTFDKLKEVNPENQKLVDYQKDIDAL